MSEPSAPPLPEPVRQTLRTLASSGVRSFVTGGALRDHLLGREPRDFDLVAEASLEDVARALPRARRITGARPVVLIAETDHGPRIEISAPRGPARNLAEDLRLRDFTGNAIAFDPERQSWIDPLGGVADLRARRLRATDPARVFVDDPLRVVRGVRQARELDLSIEPETWRAMERAAWRVCEVAGERQRDELFRTLVAPGASGILRDLRRVGALAVLLPEALRAAGVAWSDSIRNALEHALRLVEALPPRLELRLAGLLQPAALARSRRWRARSRQMALIRPWLRAEPALNRAAARLRFSRETTRAVARRIRHSWIGPREGADDAAIRRMLERVGRDILDDVLAFRRVDLTLREAPELDAWLGWESRVRKIAAQAMDDALDLAIGGKEIMRELAVPEGPEVHRWLMRARRHAWARPEDNTRERLLGWLREARDTREE